jgi:MFS family permease
MDHAGAVIGPLLAAALLAWGVGLREIFLWTLVPGVLCVGLALSVREPAGALMAQTAIDWRLSTLPVRYRLYLVVMAVFTLSQASNMFLLLRAAQLGVTPAQIPLLWALQSVTAMVLSTPLSALSDRLPRMPLIVGGWLLYGAVFGGLGAQAESPAAIALLLVLYGAVLALTEGVEKALVADMVPPERLGTAFGWFHLVSGLMLVPASIGFGWIWERNGPQAAFGLSGGLAVLAALGLVALWRRRS